jgi:hypothetical protein
MSTLKSSAEDLTLNADGSGNDIKFQSNGVEKASIDQNGSLVLNSRMTSATGTISTAGDGDNPVFQVIDTADTFVAQFEGRRDNVMPSIGLYHNDSSAHASNNGFGFRYFTNNNAGTPEKTNSASIYFQNVSVTDGAEEAKIRFLTMSSGTTADRVVIEPDGDVTVETGDIVFGTAGKGICLGVTSNTDANTLDDYEEGTWTPALRGGDTAGSPTYHGQTGWYTKVGRAVHFSGNIHNNSLVDLDGDVYITGLPFTSGTGSFTVSFGYAGSMAITASESITGYIGGSATEFKINIWNASSGIGYLDDAEFSSGCQILFSGTYHT